MKKICVVTGSRAEYGILSGLIKALEEDYEFELQIIATNMHLSPDYGLTYREIERDGFTINKKVEMLLASDTSNATSKSVGLATIGFADAYEDLKPNVILVLGDRYEILAAVQTALLYKIPVVHLHGGEITEGAYDDSIRHAITKMSHLHFTSTNDYRNRVIQMGESPNRVFNVGALGVENVLNMTFLSKIELEKQINFELSDKCFLITYHPVTLENSTAEQQFKTLLDAISEFKDYRIIFTMPNSDTDGRIIMQLIKDYVAINSDKSVYFASLGLKRYFSALKYVTAVIGNSSSGIIEVPSFGIPTLNIGHRQKGRMAGPSVIHCDTDKVSIVKGVNMILSKEHKEIAAQKYNPYSKENTTASIINILKKFQFDQLIKKTFYDLRR